MTIKNNNLKKTNQKSKFSTTIFINNSHEKNGRFFMLKIRCFKVPLFIFIFNYFILLHLIVLIVLS